MDLKLKFHFWLCRLGQYDGSGVASTATFRSVELEVEPAQPVDHVGRKVVVAAGAGRPATGKDPARTIRLSDEFVEKIDAWARRQDDRPGRSEAIRRLVEITLKAKAK